MNPKTKTAKTARTDGPIGSFDVVCLIGSVHYGPNGSEPAAVEAMRLICAHDAPGVFTFPNEYGGTTTIEVDRGNESNDRSNEHDDLL